MYLKSSDLLKAIEDSYSIYWGIILAIPANLDMSSITVIPKVENENRSQIQSKEAVAEIRIIDGDLFEVLSNDSNLLQLIEGYLHSDFDLEKRKAKEGDLNTGK